MRSQQRKPVSARKLAKLPKSNGITAIFAPISRTRGVKMFRDAGLCDDCFMFQRHLSQFELAPRVYGKPFEIRYHGEKYFAFVTQIAAVIVDNTNQDEDFRCSNCGLGRGNAKIDGEHCLQMRHCLEALNVHYQDLHAGNVGYIGRKMVLIDCDPNYFEISPNSPLWNYYAA